MGKVKAEDTVSKYSKNNMTQILKIRHLIRKNGYFANYDTEEDHTDVEKSISLDADLLDLGSIGSENLKKYMDNRENGEDEVLKIVHVTCSEKAEIEKIENKTVAELKQMIFEQIYNLPAEMQNIF